MRVKVWDGDGKTFLGEGELEEGVTVYVFRGPDDLLSLRDAEQKPPQDLIKEMASRGYAFDSFSGPRIEMDEGPVRYGCQVWWEPVELGKREKAWLEAQKGEADE